MTPEEKAKELVERFEPYVDPNEDSVGRIIKDAIKENSKSCAIIAVGEVISILINKDTALTYLEKDIQYWNEVLKYIKEL